MAGFSRYHKYTLGTELRNKSREIVAHIIRTNAERGKGPKLDRDGAPAPSRIRGRSSAP